MSGDAFARGALLLKKGGRAPKKKVFFCAMPSRKENRRRSERRQLAQVQRMAASVIQEVFRWSRRLVYLSARLRPDIDDKKTVMRRQDMLEHLMWHGPTRRAPDRALLSVQTRRSCLRREPTSLSPRVALGGVTFHEARDCVLRDDAVCKELTCRICMELADAPVFASCCPAATNYGCVCYQCAYKFLQLERNVLDRRAVRSWSLSCTNACRFSPGVNTPKLPVVAANTRLKYFASELTLHSSFVFFDRLRDEFGHSTCFACGESFDTTAALRRHLRASCSAVKVQCHHCPFYATRQEVTAHHLRTHEFVDCPCCSARVQLSRWKEHAQNHKLELEQTLTSHSGVFHVTPGGAIVVALGL